jgi:hypothetical protein
VPQASKYQKHTSAAHIRSTHQQPTISPATAAQKAHPSSSSSPASNHSSSAQKPSIVPDSEKKPTPPGEFSTPKKTHQSSSSSPAKEEKEEKEEVYDREGWIWKMGGHYFFSKRYRQRFLLLDSSARELRWSKLPETINDPSKIKGFLKLEPGMVCSGYEAQPREYVVEIKSSSPKKPQMVSRSPQPAKQGVILQFMLHEEAQFQEWMKALNTLLAAL